MARTRPIAEFAEALRQAGRDPKLKRMVRRPAPVRFRNRRSVSNPSPLPAGSALPHPDRRARQPARALMFARAGSGPSPRRSCSSPGSASGFDGEPGANQRAGRTRRSPRCRNSISGQEKFDATSPNAADLQQWLRAKARPRRRRAARPACSALASLGCKTVLMEWPSNLHHLFPWAGGELVHLAMMDRAALQHPPPKGTPSTRAATAGSKPVGARATRP